MRFSTNDNKLMMLEKVTGKEAIEAGMRDGLEFGPILIKDGAITNGIKEREQIRRGDIRKLVITARPNYSTNITQLIDFMDIRVYVKDGTSEIDVISWDKVNKSFSENFYIIDTNILIPQRYYVDVKITYGMNSIVHHDVLSFDIVNNLNNKYE